MFIFTSVLLSIIQYAFCFDAYYSDVKTLFQKEKYSEALNLLRKIDSSSSINKDELSYIKCICLQKIGNLDQAKKELSDLAVKYQSSSYAPKALKLEADLTRQQSERQKIHFQIMKYYPSSDEGSSLLTEYINSTFLEGDFLTCETLLKTLVSSSKSSQEQWATYMLALVSNISNQTQFSTSQVQGLYSILKKETSLKNYSFAQRVINRLAASNQLLNPEIVGYWTFLSSKNNSKTSITTNIGLALSKISNDELAIVAQTFINLNLTLEKNNLNTYTFSQIINGRESAVIKNTSLCNTIITAINSQKLSYKQQSDLYEILTKAPRSNPETGNYFYNYGLIQMRNGEAQKAMLTFKKGLLTTPENSNLRIQISQQLTTLETSQGVKAANPSVQDSLNSTVALGDKEYQKGNFALAKSKYSEAISKILSPCAIRFELNLKLARCAEASGAYGEALWRYSELYSNRQCPPNVAAEAANSVLRTKIYQPSNEKYSLYDFIVSRGVKPDDNLKFLIGVNLLLDRSNFKAFQIFTQLSNSHNNLSESAKRLASICTDKTISNIESQTATPQALLTEIGNISDDLPALAQGILNIVQSRAGNTLNDVIMFRRAELYLNEENVQASLPLFQKIVTNFPNSDFAPESLIRIAIIKTGFQERPAEGDIILKSITEKYPQSPQASLALFYRASLALWRNDRNRAREFFDQLIKQYPSSREVSFAKANLAQMR